MDIEQAKGVIKKITERSLKIPTLLVGPTGIGKSYVVKEIGQELNLPVIDLRLAQQEPGDLIGVPRTQDGHTVWCKPEWWPEKRSIIFFDELNRAPIDVRQAVFQVVTEWKMHTHILPENCTIVSAINPHTMRYQVEQLDPAFTRRFLRLLVYPTVDPWITWARSHLTSQEITDFILAHPDCLSRKEEFEMKGDPTPDSYRMIDVLMVNKIIPPHLQTEVLSGLVGDEAAVCMVKFLKEAFQRPVTAREVLQGFAKVKDKVIKQRNDQMHATITDLINTCKKPTEKQCKQLNLFLEVLSEEFKVALLKGMHATALEQLSLHHGNTLSKDVKKIMESVKHGPTKTRNA